MIDAYEQQRQRQLPQTRRPGGKPPRDGHEGGQVETVGMSELGTVCALFLCSFNKGVLALNYILMLQFEFVAQAVPHQCIAHHGAEHRAAAAEKATAATPPSRLWWIHECTELSEYM